MNPKHRSLLARLVLVAGVALVASLLARSAPHDQTLALTLESRQVSRVEGVITRQGESEPAAGFSQDFPARSPSPRVIRHTFSAPNDTYTVVITLRDAAADAAEGAAAESAAAESAAAESAAAESAAAERDGPIPSETSFERRVSLVGGEVIISPD